MAFHLMPQQPASMPQSPSPRAVQLQSFSQAWASQGRRPEPRRALAFCCRPTPGDPGGHPPVTLESGASTEVPLTVLFPGQEPPLLLSPRSPSISCSVLWPRQPGGDRRQRRLGSQRNRHWEWYKPFSSPGFLSFAGIGRGRHSTEARG